jgi:hypothetical protein
MGSVCLSALDAGRSLAEGRSVLIAPGSLLAALGVPPGAPASLAQLAAAEANQPTSSQQLPIFLAPVCMIAASQMDSCRHAWSSLRARFAQRIIQQNPRDRVVSVGTHWHDRAK